MKTSILMKALSVTISIIMILFLVACGTASNNQTTALEQKGTESTKAESATQLENIDPIGRYDPAIEVTAVRSLGSNIKYPEGDSMENNVWTRAYEKELGIKIKYLWTVDDSQYEQKVNVTLASGGNLPDIICIKNMHFSIFGQLVKSGFAADLTEVYDKYASPLIKKIYNDDGGAAMNALKSNGKLMALFHVNSSINQLPLLWVRTDWLKKLSLPEPKTMADFLTISDAFAKNDPDGNGKADTVSLGLEKNMFSGGLTDLEGFFACYHAYPNMWIKDSQGKLAFGSIQPQVKTALDVLLQMYKQGQIDKEFGIKDSTKVAEDIAAGKVGMEFGQMWNPLYPLNQSKEKDASAEWMCYPIPSADGSPALPPANVGFDDVFVLNKDAKHPEAMVKLMNFATEKLYGETADMNTYLTNNGIEVHLLSMMYASPVKGLVDAQRNIAEAFKSGDALKLTSEEKGYYDGIAKYKGGDVTGWGYDRVFGAESSFSVIGDIYADNPGMYFVNEFFGAPTKTMTQKKSTLDKLQAETFAKIIMGEASIDEFDKFVEQWKKLGGDDITNEVNEWFKSK